MNILLQIGLGLLPGTVIVIMFLIKRRAFNLNKILLTLLLTVSCGTMIFYGGQDFISNYVSDSELSHKEMISFAYALIEEGAYDEATEVIEEYSNIYGYDDDCRLLNARIALFEEDYESARGLYKYLSENTNLIDEQAEEVKLANGTISGNSADLVMIEYLKELGEDITEYGYTETSFEEIKKIEETSVEDIEIDIKNKIEAQYSISDDASNFATAVAGVSDAYTDLLEEGPFSQYRSVFNEIEERSPQYLKLDSVNKGRIKSYIMAGDYGAITEGLNDRSSYHELMISAELYMSGLVKKSDFSDDYHKTNSSDVLAIKNRLNKISRNNQKGLTVQEKNALKARVSAISNQLDNPALVAMKEQLTVAAKNEAGTDETKVYLELAKIEDYFENQTSADSYISQALYSSQDNKDDNYVAAMSKIITVINNDEDSDTENIKNVSEYVNTVLDHSLTVNVEKIISPQYQPPRERDKDDSIVGDNHRSIIGNNDGSIVEDINRPIANFVQTAVDYVSRVKSSISIGKIDTSNFEDVVARVQIDSDYISNINELKSALEIYDTGSQITDFTLNKINYTGSNIMLVCDVSGSMSGSIQALRDAVVTFIKDKNPMESLSVVTFSDTIVDVKSFGTPDESLISFAESMTARGGTDMFSAVVNSLGSMPSNISENNVLILLTDGQDNDPKSSEAIYAEIGQLASRKDVTVYTMGLGSDVDTGYLNTISRSGNGEFVYVSNSDSLTSFYNMIHSQLYSQYEISYKAQDTMTKSDRTLEVKLPEEKLRDVKTYWLQGEDTGDGGLGSSQDLSISGMSPKHIYKGLQDITVKLNGRGFKSDSSIMVKLNGNIDYTVTPKYVDEETYTIEIPSSVAVGVYNVEVTIDGKKKVLENGFSVIVQGDEKKTAFGPYEFTSAQRIDNGNENHILRGGVTMNGWLHFKGDVIITGDYTEGGSIRVSDYSGSYVEYDKATSAGIGNFLADKGIPINLPALHDFTLYNDQANIYNYSKYQVDDISTGILEVYNVLRFDSPIIRLYPNSIGLYYSTGTTILPYQKQILKAASNTKDLFKFSFDGSAQITNKNVGIVLDTSYKDPSKTNFNQTINLLNSPVYFNGEYKVKMNTLKSEYTIGAMVRMAFFAKQSGLGAEISWEGNLVPDSVKLGLELAQAVKLPTTVPIEVNNFTFEVSEINTAVENGRWTNLRFTGGADFSSLSVKAYFPALERFVGNISLFEMPETTASLRVSPFTMEANANLKFLSEIKLAEAGVKLGKFNYTNSLLKLDGASVNGLSANLKTGFMWATADNRVNVEVSGTGELNAHTRFLGVNYDGLIEYDIGWWIINTESKKSGSIALGLYRTHNDKNQLVFAYKTQNSKGKVKGNFYYIDENGKCGKNNGVLK